ncbi:uncharacterized protein [Triticum aestivum]|uniref:uncharacterized protein isoform X4 n=1 Tax=Triticum aestivum TaxID=4565 RepID=UPI001D01941C|nr:uncharacterized protein LOC123096529 isoform X4 [Triticum aestivum]
MHMLTQRIIKMGGGEPVSATTGVRQVQGFSHARASTGSDLHPFPHAWDPQPPTSHVDPGWLLCPECRCRPPCSMASVPSYGCVCANHLMHQKARFTNSSSICFSVHRLPIAVWHQNSHQFRGARITVSLCYRNLSLIRHRTSPSSHFGKLSLLAPVPGSHEV